MKIDKILFLPLLMSISFSFYGCMEDNNNTIVDENTTKAVGSSEKENLDANKSTSSVDTILLMSVISKEIKLNNEVVNIKIKVIDETNNPYSKGNIKIVYPNDVRSGRDIGYFDLSTVALSNGIADFSYHAPSDLQSNKSDIIFSFYHDENPTSLKEYTIKINPEVNQTILTNYYLSTANKTDVRIGLQSSKLVSYYVQNENNKTLADSYMKSITISSLNPSLGTLEDSLGNVGDSLMIEDKNNISINVKSNTKSGVVPLKVKAVFNDANGVEQILENVFNMLVVSGPPSAISLSYASTEQDREYAKFVENWVLTVTDKYNNKVNSNPVVSMGMLASYAKDSSTPGRNIYEFLYYKPSIGGELQSAEPFDIFESNCDIFANVDQENDVLVLFGDGYKYNASGKWDFYEHNLSALELVDDFNGTKVTDLGFAVGNNHRQDSCDEGVEWVANVYPKDNNYILDNDGRMIIKVEYDYYLTGKDVVLWTNLTGYQHDSKENVRIGEAKKITLRGQGLESYIDKIAVPKATTATYRIPIKISNTNEYYQNARFGGYNIKASDTIIINDISDSNNDIINNCIAYVDVNVTSDINKTGTIELQNVLIVNEF